MELLLLVLEMWRINHLIRYLIKLALLNLHLHLLLLSLRQAINRLLLILVPLSHHRLNLILLQNLFLYLLLLI
jgi:hypothetical protein